MPLNKFLIVAVFVAITAASALAGDKLKPYAATPDRVLVIYNADWKNRSEGSAAEQDSREVAEYFAAMHADPKSGKKPYLLGLSCRHPGKKHLNDWAIREASTDNRNGIAFRGKGPAPGRGELIRDSRKVEVHISEPDADWETLRISCRSEVTGEEKVVPPISTALQISGIPAKPGNDAVYPPPADGKGRSIRLDATRFFAGTVTVSITLKNHAGTVLRDLKLRYHDIRNFIFSPTGPDNIPDDKILEEDLLTPVRTFLEDPRNALPDGTRLKDHILYIVVVHGVPYAGNGIFGVDHGVTSSWGEHGSLTSVEQRLQTIYYPWATLRPPVISLYNSRGKDSDKGVINHLITTAMRNPLGGARWNPYMHPDTYSYLQKGAPPPTFINLPPFERERREKKGAFFAYAVSRIDGNTPEEAKRLIDYAVYASKYLRSEMDAEERVDTLKRFLTPKLSSLLESAVVEKSSGGKELAALGFPIRESEGGQGVPFMVRPASDTASPDKSGTRDWRRSGFYPGGIERFVKSSNGLNKKDAGIWQLISQGVTVTAAGSPAGSGGPHITNTTFWDNRVLLKYLLRGRDLGECFLRSTYHVNWSTSLIGDPLFHPDLNHTIVDETPPRASKGLAIQWAVRDGKATAMVGTELDFDPSAPEVALMNVTVTAADTQPSTTRTALYSRRPTIAVTGLKPGSSYHFTAELTDPYGNRSVLREVVSAAPGSGQ
ncbi:hypothetical protein GeomeDRAFT_1575 [Geobacter metallireducens RCH3]|uniref:Outer membrane channel n=1 Tax=Geobacter metallireducens (strain ATCC 53774 / DSM 7210 / GS-15) TaxID=269799 RepID=Q39U50_GEOMG|nr:hypothetical protein [Geobacter metallireducens]ABB32224.1 outer membrane channel [Geobacter metallireducens GS-15]EHP87008.1 hypothetical protein GeomeDRAFT_1575 [Geobacter metallireducens RCH3]